MDEVGGVSAGANRGSDTSVGMAAVWGADARALNGSSADAAVGGLAVRMKGATMTLGVASAESLRLSFCAAEFEVADESADEGAAISLLRTAGFELAAC